MEAASLLVLEVLDDAVSIEFGGLLDTSDIFSGLGGLLRDFRE